MTKDINIKKPTTYIQEKKLLSKSGFFLELCYNQTNGLLVFPKILAFLLQHGFLAFIYFHVEFWHFKLSFLSNCTCNRVTPAGLF